MSDPAQSAQATAKVISSEETTAVVLGGTWSLQGSLPRWERAMHGLKPTPVFLRAEGLGDWDSSAVVFVGDALRWCRQAGMPADISGLPERLRLLAGQFDAALSVPAASQRQPGLLEALGLWGRSAARRAVEAFSIIGECCTGFLMTLLGKPGFRWSDCFAEIQKCGVMALPIVSLISFLVGVTLSYSGSIVLRRFGANIWVADLIGVAMTREMGSLMAAIVLAGRTGAAFAAEIGSMRANDEVDALSVVGISPARFLVMPRVVALGLMMPLLAVYATCLGIVGGMVVAYTLLDIAPAAYWAEMLTIVDLPDLSVGIIKAVVFGAIVGISGCLRGLQAERSAAGVGHAATSAVVTAILLIVVADAVFAVLFHAIGL